MRALLTGMGISEAMPLPFLAPGDLARAGLGDDGITVTNPLVAEESIMRTSLRPGLLKAVAYNAARRTTGVSLFEIGRINALWRRLARHMAVTQPGVANGPVDGLHPSRSGQVLADGQPVGALGEIDPQVLDAHEIDERVAWLEVDLGALLGADRGLAPYRAPSRYPSSDIDLAFTVPDEVSADEVAATIAQAGGELLASVALFDVFRSEQLGEGCRSLAYTLRFEASDRTLNDAEVAAARQSCIDAVTATHNATLRG